MKKYKRFQQTTSTSTEDTEAVPTSPPVSEALAENGLTVMQKLLDEAGLLRGNENLLSLLGVSTRGISMKDFMNYIFSPP